MAETIYAQVLLLDNKIESWKICQDKKSSPYEFMAYWKQDRYKDYTMETRTFTEGETEVVGDWTFNFYVYNVLAPEWINDWEYADDYRGSVATKKTLEDVVKSNQHLEKMLGGRVKITGTLGRS